VRAQQIGHAGSGQLACRDHARQITAGVNMGHVEVAAVLVQESPESPRQEELSAIRQRVRNIPEHALLDVDLRTARLINVVGQPPRCEKGVRCTDGDAMAARDETVRESSDDARDAAVGPRVAGVGRDVEDAKCRHREAGQVCH